MKRLGISLAVVALSAAGLAAQEPVLQPLVEMFDGLRLQVSRFSPTPAPALPKPDRATLDYLASRVPGLAVDRVRLVPLDDAEAALRKAVVEKKTYLQWFTGEAFQGGDILYFSKDVLAAIETRYSLGTLPLSGRTSDGRTFRMEAFLGGAGRFHYLYDLRGDFKFKDGDRNFSIGDGGRVEAAVLGSADLSFKGYGVEAFMGMFTDIQQIAQTSASRIHVTTGMGAGDGDILPIHLK